jgi:peptide-methionine (S)-S-oxide reductase
VQGAEERRLAEASKAAAEQELGRTIVTEIRDATTFYDAEAYHQDFYRTHPTRYNSYRSGCGRDRRLQELWGESAH